MSDTGRRKCAAAVSLAVLMAAGAAGAGERVLLRAAPEKAAVCHGQDVDGLATAASRAGDLRDERLRRFQAHPGAMTYWRFRAADAIWKERALRLSRAVQSAGRAPCAGEEGLGH